MASLNKVMLIGNLTREPELRYLANGTAIAKLGIAVNRRYKDKSGKTQEEATFFNLVAFEKRAETLGKYAKKGSSLFIDGRLQARTVTNDKGESRTYYDVCVEGFQFLSAGAAKQESGEIATEGEDE